MTRFMHSRYTLLVAIFIATACAWAYSRFSIATAPSGYAGLILAWSAPWSLSASAALWSAVAMNIAAAVLIAYLNKTYNLLRTMTWLPGSMFLFLQLGTPGIVASLGSGMVVCICVLWCLFLLYESYDDPMSERCVFLIFFLLSALATIDISAMALMLVFWVGCAQMRILSLRTILASLMGIATPWIILFGFGIVSLADIAMPNVISAPDSITSFAQPGVVGVAAFTIFIALCAWIQGFMKMISYNAKTRSMMGVVTMLFLFACIFSILGSKHIGSWLPMINLFAALHIGHMFGAIHRQNKSFIAIIILMFIYLALYTWKLTASLF